MARKVDAVTRAGIDLSDFEVAVTHYIERTQACDAATMQRNFGRQIETFAYGIEKGRRYWRVWRGIATEAGVTQRTALAFVDTHSGDVLKAASWKSPAPGARANVLRM